MPTDQNDNQQAPPEPVKAKKPRKPRGPNKPKVKPVDKPIEIPDDHPALATQPDPRIDAEAAVKNVQIRPAALTWPEFEAQIIAKQNQQPAEYTPPKPTERQQARIDEEIAAGRRRLAHFEAQEKLRVQPPPDPNEPKNVQVFRPGNSVPGINSKDPAIASVNLK